MAQYFGRPARMRFLPWEEWRKGVTEDDATATWDHISHSPNCSIQKARNLLGYKPRYTSIQAVRESVDWLIQKGVVRSK
jgi:nucleoside-diphosphate-sugar epimerase